MAHTSDHIEEMVLFWSNPENKRFVNKNSRILGDQFLDFGMKKSTLGFTSRSYSTGTFVGHRFSSKKLKESLISTGFVGGTIFWKVK